MWPITVIARLVTITKNILKLCCLQSIFCFTSGYENIKFFAYIFLLLWSKPGTLVVEARFIFSDTCIQAVKLHAARCNALRNILSFYKLTLLFIFSHDIQGIDLWSQGASLRAQSLLEIKIGSFNQLLP